MIQSIGSMRSISTVCLLAGALLMLASCEDLIPPEREPERDEPEPGAPEQPDEGVPGDVPAADGKPLPLILKPNLRILDDGELASVADDSVTFAAPVGYEVGDVLAIGTTEVTPVGFLRKIAAVSADGRTIRTESATLEDAIESGDLIVDATLQEGPGNGNLQRATASEKLYFPLRTGKFRRVVVGAAVGNGEPVYMVSIP